MFEVRVVILAALLTVPSVAGAATVADFVTGCTTTTNLGAALCECSAKKAQGEMSPKAFEFLVAIVAKDKAAQAALAPQLSVEEMMKAGTFMTRGPAACGRQQATP